MKTTSYSLLLILLSLLLISCEEEFLPAESVYKKELVIESYIEKNDASLPVFAILTYTLPFYSSFNIDVINNSYVKNAEVTIFDGQTRYDLPQLCLNDIQEPLRSEIIKNFGYNPDSFKTDLCVYVDLAKTIPVETGKTYELRAITNGDTLYSTTQIPDLIPIDSFWFDKPAGKNKNDTFAQLFCIISDLPNQKDYYRYFTAGQNERLIPNATSGKAARSAWPQHEPNHSGFKPAASRMVVVLPVNGIEATAGGVGRLAAAQAAPDSVDGNEEYERCCGASGIDRIGTSARVRGGKKVVFTDLLEIYHSQWRVD